MNDRNLFSIQFFIFSKNEHKSYQFQANGKVEKYNLSIDLYIYLYIYIFSLSVRYVNDLNGEKYDSIMKYD